MKVQIQQTVEMPVWFYSRGTKELINLDTRSTVEAKSGPFGKGALPPGQYTVEPAKDLDPKDERNKPYRDKLGNAWFARLVPTFETFRAGFGVHPDGNVPGTEGCIGIVAANTLDWRRQFERYGVLYVV